MNSALKVKSWLIKTVVLFMIDLKCINVLEDNFCYDLLFYFTFNDINLAMDMTIEFSWITDEGRMKFINGSTELTKDEKESLLSYFD